MTGDSEKYLLVHFHLIIHYCHFFCHLLYVIWSTFSINCLFPAIWIFNSVTPTFSGWYPACRSCDVTAKINERKHYCFHYAIKLTTLFYWISFKQEMKTAFHCIKQSEVNKSRSIFLIPYKDSDEMVNTIGIWNFPNNDWIISNQKCCCKQVNEPKTIQMYGGDLKAIKLHL